MRSPFFLSVAALLFLQNGAEDISAAELAYQIDVAGVKLGFVDDPGSATLAARELEKHKLQIHVTLKPDARPLQVGVELPTSGPNAWPASDVETLDARGQTVAAEHIGIEWRKFTIVASPAQDTFLIQVVKPASGRPRVFSDKERDVTDPVTGMSARIGKWYDGRQAALCIRFDDSHPTHLSTAIPALREYGFRGTFMINPGKRDDRSPPRWRSAFEADRNEWEAVAQRGDQEFANHTLHHRERHGRQGCGTRDRRRGENDLGPLPPQEQTDWLEPWRRNEMDNDKVVAVLPRQIPPV